VLDGFHPAAVDVFFARRRVAAFVAAVIVVGGPLIWVFTLEQPEETVEVALAPDIQDFAVEEEPPEEEIVEEPPPPPPPNVKIKKVKGPVKRSKIETPDEKPTDAADESDKEKEYLQPEGETSLTGAGNQPGMSRGKREKPKPKPKPEPPQPKKVRPRRTPVDPTKPIDRPENATAPKPKAGNPQPQYPKSLRDEGITGRVVIKIHVHRDGTVRGAKVLSKKNNATGEEAQNKANKLFLAAVIKVIKTWKYAPATLEGKPISVWHTVTFPFTLTD
jgi:protein TonB